MRYAEWRKFDTSVASQEVCAGVCKPSGLISRNDGGSLIAEGDDNVDINSETIDGKESFH